MTIDQENFADQAESLMQKIKFDPRDPFTTTKMRNIYALCAGLHGEARRNTDPILSDELQGQVQYFKMRIAYECGRSPTAKYFVETCKIKENIDGIGDKKENLMLFCRYMEALVAYHKFYHDAVKSRFYDNGTKG